MLRSILLVLLLLIAPVCSDAGVVSFGQIDSTLEYSDLVIGPDGSQIVITNRSANGREEFYIILTATNFRRATVYRHRIYVDFIPGYGSVIADMPSYLSTDGIFDIRFEIRKPREMDVHVR